MKLSHCSMREVCVCVCKTTTAAFQRSCHTNDTLARRPLLFHTASKVPNKGKLNYEQALKVLLLGSC